MTEAPKPDARGLVVHPVQDQRLEAINERIAELVAEALFNRLVKNVLANKIKHGIIPLDGKGAG